MPNNSISSIAQEFLPDNTVKVLVEPTRNSIGFPDAISVLQERYKPRNSPVGVVALGGSPFSHKAYLACTSRDVSSQSPDGREFSHGFAADVGQDSVGVQLFQGNPLRGTLVACDGTSFGEDPESTAKIAQQLTNRLLINGTSTAASIGRVYSSAEQQFEATFHRKPTSGNLVDNGLLMRIISERSSGLDPQQDSNPISAFVLSQQKKAIERANTDLGSWYPGAATTCAVASIVEFDDEAGKTRNELVYSWVGDSQVAVFYTKSDGKPEILKLVVPHDRADMQARAQGTSYTQTLDPRSAMEYHAKLAAGTDDQGIHSYVGFDKSLRIRHGVLDLNRLHSKGYSNLVVMIASDNAGEKIPDDILLKAYSESGGSAINLFDSLTEEQHRRDEDDGGLVLSEIGPRVRN